MRIQYFRDTDTLLLELSDRRIVDTRDLTEDALVELDGEGRLVSITIEHASAHTDVAALPSGGSARVGETRAPG